MKLENQVCTRLQGQRLEELGINVKPLFCHCRVSTNLDDSYNDILPTQWELQGLPSLATTFQAPAFTTAELGVMLPPKDGIYSVISMPSGEWCICDVYENQPAGDGFKTEAEARAAFIIEMLAAKNITAEEINQRLLNS